MVDVSQKDSTNRAARASGKITLTQPAFELVSGQTESRKGSVLTVAQIAGIMAAKNTHSLIPLCHNIALSHVSVTFDLQPESRSVCVCAGVRSVGVTGVEMEALAAVAIALLTVYDMTKSVSHDHVISDVRLDEKTGGKSGHYSRDDDCT